MGALFNLQPTEQIGIDVGAQYFANDGRSTTGPLAVTGAETEAFRSMLNVFGGLRFDFNNNVGLRGIYYHQQIRGDAGSEWDRDNAHAYKLALDIKQDLLGFSSLWLGYDFMEAGFITPGEDGYFDPLYRGIRNWDYDMRTWRLGAIQQPVGAWSGVYAERQRRLRAELRQNRL
jgi:hypothetical protein